MTDQFAAITAFLSEADPADLASLTFDDLCRRHSAAACRMNHLFCDNFGMCGDEIIAHLVDC